MTTSDADGGVWCRTCGKPPEGVLETSKTSLGTMRLYRCGCGNRILSREVFVEMTTMKTLRASNRFPSEFTRRRTAR